MSIQALEYPNNLPALYLNNQVNQVMDVTTTATLTALKAGGLISVANAGSAYTIHLPVVSDAAGCTFTFLLSGSPNAAITIASTTAVVYGQLADITTGFNTAIGAHSSCIIGTTATRGTQVVMKSDGVTYFCHAVSLVSGSITFA